MNSAIGHSAAPVVRTLAESATQGPRRATSLQSWNDFEQFLRSAIQPAVRESSPLRAAGPVRTPVATRQDSDSESGNRQIVVPLNEISTAAETSTPVVVPRSRVTTEATGAATGTTTSPGATTTSTEDSSAPATTNPFAIPYDYTGGEAAALVAKYLGGTVLGKNIGMNVYPFGQPLTDIWTVSVGGQQYQARILAEYLNECSPDLLRVRLNEAGITALGPPPLASKVAYVSNYALNPTSHDPGPLPAWATPAAAETEGSTT
jgi:hypothetical protein